jgi:endo-1,4-beta-xylanase
MNNNWLRRDILKLGLGLGTGVGVASAISVYEDKYIQALDNPRRSFAVAGKGSLKERAAAKGVIYGSAIKYPDLSNKKLAVMIAHECKMLVPEWEFKWTAGSATLRPGFDQFDFTAADRMASFAKTHNLLLRGHTLVWHESLPRWFEKTVTSKNAEQLLTNHIQTVVGHYAGKIHSWDVVNEAVEPRERRSDNLRISPWLKLLGPNYIDLAFRLTAAADPQALLVYNDYGLDYDTPEDEAKRNAVLKLLRQLKSQRTPIHALGIQAHLSPGNHRFNPKKLKKFLRDVANLGLKIMITEMDVADKYLPFDVKMRDRIIAATYEDYLSVVLSEPAVISVVTWGLSDRYTWLNESNPRRDRAAIRPLPFDRNFQPKLAWNAIARAFDRAPKR